MYVAIVLNSYYVFYHYGYSNIIPTLILTTFHDYHIVIGFSQWSLGSGSTVFGRVWRDPLMPEHILSAREHVRPSLLHPMDGRGWMTPRAPAIGKPKLQACPGFLSSTVSPNTSAKFQRPPPVHGQRRLQGGKVSYHAATYIGAEAPLCLDSLPHHGSTPVSALNLTKPSLNQTGAAWLRSTVQYPTPWAPRPETTSSKVF